MLNTDGQRKIVVAGLKQYLKCEVIRANQTATMPQFPYVGYNITTLASENKGTYGKYEDGVDRKPIVQTWSITVHSDNYNEAVNLANMAHEWLDYVGTQYLDDNDVIVQSVGSVSDRSNLLTSEYIYSQGFDCFFFMYDEIGEPDFGYIESVGFESGEYIEKMDTEEIISELNRTVDTMNVAFRNVEIAIEEKGVDVPDNLPVTDYYKMIKQITGGVTDSELSLTSSNPVMNKVVTAALNEKQDESELEEAALKNSEIESLLN